MYSKLQESLIEEQNKRIEYENRIEIEHRLKLAELDALHNNTTFYFNVIGLFQD